MQLFLKAVARVEGAANGEEALAQLESDSFDGVLLDVNLGEERTGLELIEIIRQIDGYDATPIVAFTAYALPGDRERFLQAGFDSYVPKPFTKRQLLRTLDQVLTVPPRRSSSRSRSPR